MSENQYLGDRALEDKEDDLFSRWPFSLHIAETLAKRSDPSSLVVGIYGAWGEGKTTVINYIKIGLAGIDDVIAITFNPWIFPNENELLLSFFKTISDGLGRKLKTRSEDIGEAITKYAGLLATASRGASDAAKGLGGIMSNVDVEEYKKRIESILKEENKRLVIFMDDIDRLDKSEIQAIFRLVKLSADFNNTSYVLAFDEKMVAAALSEKYSSADQDSGQNFLEKIIQVPLNLPPANRSALEAICFRGIDEVLKITNIELEEKQVHEFRMAFYKGISTRLYTPRMAKRYVNVIQFALPIMNGEVNPIDLMLIEGIRVFYPKLHHHIKNNRDVYLSSSSTSYGTGRDQKEDELKKRREEGIVSLNESEKSSARELILILFPRTGSTMYGSDWDASWAKEQKISSQEYFDRYFSYGIPVSDVSDIKITEYLTEILTCTSKKSVEKLKQLLAGKEEKLIRKLRANEEHCSEKQSIKLATSLALVGDVLPNPENLSFYSTPFVQAAILISHLLKNINKNKRYKIAKQIIEKGVPIYYACECLRWMHSDKDTAEVDRLLNDKDENKLKKCLAARIKEEAEIEPLYKKYPRYSPSLLSSWKWGVSKEETSAYLENLFNKSNKEALEFLLTYVPTAWGMETGIPHKSDFTRDHYNSIESIVAPDILKSALIEDMGDQIEVQDYPHLHDNNDDIGKVAAMQFCYIHNVAIKEQKEPPEENDESNIES